MTGTGRMRVYSGGPWEHMAGYCRATRAGDHIFVSGSTAMKDGELVGKDDPAAQTRQTLRTIADALAALDSSIDDVVRYRIYLTRIDDWQDVISVLAETFGDVHPSGTLVAVSALIRPDLLVEIEADAIAGSAAPVARTAGRGQ